MAIIEYPKWIYHAAEKPKIVQNEDERKEHKDWKDSPHEFVNYANAGVDMEDHIDVQLAGEATQDVVDLANDSLKLDDMNRSELEAFADKRGIDIDKRRNDKGIVNQIKQALKG